MHLPPQLPPHLRPTILTHKILLLRINNPLQLRLLIPKRTLPLPQPLLQLLPLILAHVYGIAAVAGAVLAAVGGELGAALGAGHLAEAGFALFGECFHTLPTTAILDSKLTTPLLLRH